VANFFFLGSVAGGYFRKLLLYIYNSATCRSRLDYKIVDLICSTGPFLSILVQSCQFLSILFNSCPILSIFVNSCQFLSFLVNSCQFLSILVNSCQFLSILVNSCQFLGFSSSFLNSCQFLSIIAHSCSILSICVPVRLFCCSRGDFHACFFNSGSPKGVKARGGRRQIACNLTILPTKATITLGKI
jgi:hypothetical protein